jgi:hypothetical protein
VVNAISWLFYVQERYLVPTVKEAGWAPQPVWTSKKNLTPKRVQTPNHPAHYELDTAYSSYCTSLKNGFLTMHFNLHVARRHIVSWEVQGFFLPKSCNTKIKDFLGSILHFFSTNSREVSYVTLYRA